MATARLMTRPEDYAKLGIKEGMVEPWEDGRRDTPTPGHNEVWYSRRHHGGRHENRGWLPTR